MILSSRRIADLLGEGLNGPDPLVVTPLPDLTALRRHGGNSSVDLRLGTWFVAPRPGATPVLAIPPRSGERESGRFTKTIFVSLGRPFILHPQNFVLASTLEWIRLPAGLAGSVVGKSSWGRRGLVIATATSVHPRFSGCLTLELGNIGEVPIEVSPGMLICQLVLQEVDAASVQPGHSQFMGYRRPVLGDPPVDEGFELMRRPQR